MALAAGVASGGVRSAPQASPALTCTRSEHLITTEKVLRGLSSLSVQRHGHSNYLKHIPLAYRPWSGQGAAVVARAGRRLLVGAVVVPLVEATHGPCNGHPTRRGPGKGHLWVGGGMGPCVGHVNAATPTRSGPPRPFFFFCFLAAPEKPEPPRNGIKNRALLCFEVPVASGPSCTTGHRAALGT